MMDDLYLLLIAPTLLISLFAQFKLKSTFNKYTKVNASRRITGKETAELLLCAGDVRDVRVISVKGYLTDHYAPSSKHIGLSEAVHNQTSIAAIGVAAHEVGHAVQYAKSWAPIKIRNPLWRISNFGSSLGPVFATLGIILSFPILIDVGILFFSAAVLFSVLTLPVEFNASRRALALLRENNILTDAKEIKACKKVLSAAAFTYVASTLTAIASLLRLVLLSRRHKRR